MFQFPGFALNPYGFRVQYLHLTLRSATPSSLMPSQYKGSKVGFPIRRSLDQSLFAAPQGLSQRTTSFIASQRQGIHQMLLRHLIALVIHVRRLSTTACISAHTLGRVQAIRKTWLPSLEAVCLPNRSGWRPAGPLLVARTRRSGDRIYSLFTISNTRERPIRDIRESL